MPLDQYYLETLGQQGLTLAAKKKRKSKKKIKTILNPPFVIQNQNKLFVVGYSLVVRFKINFQVNGHVTTGLCHKDIAVFFFFAEGWKNIERKQN